MTKGIGGDKMDPKHLFPADQYADMCVYCGDSAETRDHVPSLILLDDPLPPNLPVVGACKSCNNGFSLDEQYLACLLECTLCGTTILQELNRKKIKDTLKKTPALQKIISDSCHIEENGEKIWIPNIERVNNVLLKLARGHTIFELNLPQFEDPANMWDRSIITMATAEVEEFESAGSQLVGWPEIGSRAFLRACGVRPYNRDTGPWITVQPGRYRYSVEQNGNVIVRIVLSEYLACHIEWDS